jgi:hypothetical protein
LNSEYLIFSSSRKHSFFHTAAKTAASIQHTPFFAAPHPQRKKGRAGLFLFCLVFFLVSAPDFSVFPLSSFTFRFFFSAVLNQ